MGQIIVVTSLKGGVGKTVFSASLAYAMARLGKRVLAVDMDLGTGGLDIALGREDSVLPTFLDLLNDPASREDAFVLGSDGIYFLSAPVFFNETALENVEQSAFDDLIAYVKDRFDAVIFDMPAGGGAAFRFLEDCPMVDQTLLVTTSAPTAIRAAERCAMRLKCPEKAKLLLNCFHVSRPGDNPFRVVEVIMRTSVPILGVVPFDEGAERSLAKGVPLAANKKSLVGNAAANVALRLMGETVPLFSGVMPKRKRIRFY
ncbi:MAG: AAA family ATPase [Clostridia bacterium]|nr:AAA family ATPase [Clostridia bacterium]